jgi:drug/metabolite transporter (DMT)-like permease
MAMSNASAQHNTQTFPPSLVAATVLWCAVVGSGTVATKIANAGISPVFQAGLRSLFATILVLGYCWLRRKHFNFFDASLFPGIAAGVMFGMEFWLLYEGLNHTTVARAVLFLYTAPFFVAPLAHWLLPNDKISRSKLLGLIVAFVGVGLAFVDRLFPSGAMSGTALVSSSLSQTPTLKGDLLCIAAALFWGLSTIVVKGSRLRSEPPEKNLIYQLATSAVMLLVASWLIGEQGIFASSTRVWLGFAYQTVIVASVAYLVWFTLIAKYSASTMHAFTFLSPVFGVIAGTLMLKEPLGWNIVAALVMVALGLWLVNRG